MHQKGENLTENHISPLQGADDKLGQFLNQGTYVTR
jgi:hypothetical protein